jgi:hypothetical protein
MLGFSQILTNTVYLEGEGKIEYLHLAQRREREREKDIWAHQNQSAHNGWIGGGRQVNKIFVTTFLSLF